MDNDVTISELMTSDVVYAGLDNTFTQVKDLFLNYNLHHLPVTDNGALVGIISNNDVTRYLLENAAKLNDWEEHTVNAFFNVEDMMTKDVVHIAPKASIETAVRVFTENNFQSLPVVELGKLVGILTLRDLVNYIYQEGI